jgi:putative membrane protein
VATVTALVPLALVDVVATFIINLRMIRKVSAIYGGRSSLLGSWRLARLVATGAVAIADDLITAVAGGSVLSKLSQKFGEGIIDDALTARVGVAAMQVCWLFGFHARKLPSVTCIIKHALVGVFTSHK